MIDFLHTFALETWDLVAEMAPYLLFGFAVAGVLHVLIRKEFIKRLLGKPGIGGVVKASLIGVPMPLCSCSVIPVAASLRKSGASRGSTASFLASTPQTGVDSILATYALMGWIFTTVRVIVAFVCGILSGFLIEWFTKKSPQNGNINPPHIHDKAPDETCCAGTDDDSQQKRNVSEALRYGFITLPGDLAAALILGLVLAGLISSLLPHDLLTGNLSSGPLAFFLATAISLPLYVCATGSIPMAYALIAAGLSPGAALVFLITGPATNTATIVTIWKMLGRGATTIYLATLVIVSWIAGGLLNSILTRDIVENAHLHEILQPALWQHISGIALVAVLFFSIYREKRKTNDDGCCPSEETEETSCCHR